MAIRLLNTKDGLSNLFKMFTEFGIFTFIILFYFIKYIRNIQNINPYNLFIIVLFVTMCIRGVGYFNGGFIFCLLEFFYCKKFLMSLNLKKINISNNIIINIIDIKIHIFLLFLNKTLILRIISSNF